MRGLDPRIHLLAKRMDCRVKPGNDDRNWSMLSGNALGWRFRSSYHSCRESDMRSSEPQPHYVRSISAARRCELRNRSTTWGDSCTGLPTVFTMLRWGNVTLG